MREKSGERKKLRLDGCLNDSLAMTRRSEIGRVGKADWH